jgi:hypothetical protein
MGGRTETAQVPETDTRSLDLKGLPTEIRIQQDLDHISPKSLDVKALQAIKSVLVTYIKKMYGNTKFNPDGKSPAEISSGIDRAGNAISAGTTNIWNFLGSVAMPKQGTNNYTLLRNAIIKLGEVNTALFEKSADKDIKARKKEVGIDELKRILGLIQAGKEVEDEDMDWLRTEGIPLYQKHKVEIDNSYFSKEAP